MYHTYSLSDALHNFPAKLKRSVRLRGWFGTMNWGFGKSVAYFADRLAPSRYYEMRLNRDFDARFGVQTMTYVELSELQIERGDLAHCNDYAPVSAMTLQRLLPRIKVRYEDFIFVDLGSGKGRSLLLASDWPFKKLVGVEFAGELHRVAQDNIRKYKSPTQKCRNFELAHLDAANYPIPNEKTIFFLFNPFHGEVMAKVLSNIQRSLAEHPRDVFIIYYNPKHRDLVAEFGFVVVESAKMHVIYKNGIS